MIFVSYVINVVFFFVFDCVVLLISLKIKVGEELLLINVYVGIVDREFGE